MFGRKKMYKKGLEDAMRAYEDFGKKQEEAIKKLREEVKSGNKKLEDMLNEIGENINGVYDYLTDREKAALYHLCTPKDIKELDESERRLLVAVLYQLANDEGGWDLTDYQKKYVRSVQKYLEITNPQTEIGLSAIENIDSIESQKVILQVVLEFMYLQDSDEISDQQEDFLGYFSLNKKQAEQIEQYVAKLYNTVGAEGICEKYGFVDDEGELLYASENSGVNANVDFYYDFRIGAARMWSDNRVIFEPREQCSLHNMRWTDHLLIWSGKGTGEWICHVTDLRTLQDIATFKEDEVKPQSFRSISGDYNISSKYFCVCSGADKRCYIVKDYTNSFYKEFQYNQYIYQSIDAITENSLILDCSNTIDANFTRNVVRYNFIDGTSEIIDSFQNESYRVKHIYVIDEKLYFVIQIMKGFGKKSGYDIWCYDLKLRKYSWKQYCVFEDYSLRFWDQILSYDGKAEIFADGDEKLKRIVFDLKDGILLSEQKVDCGEIGPYRCIQKIDHTIICMNFGYRNGRDFYIRIFTFDSLDDKLNTDRNIEWEHTEQGNEIIEKMRL